jgi:DNA invertase Pin-like site-specific DNA recombinase
MAVSLRQSERTRAGMDRAKVRGTKSGKAIGRPVIAPKMREQIAKLIAAGASPYRVAKNLGIDRHMVKKY